MRQPKISRRQFLKVSCLTAGTAAVAGCGTSYRQLVPYVIPPEDIVPGEATWYATTCRECPAGCGMLAKNRDGHVIKVEGNPTHPVNTGKLCPRGQASVQGIYNPDRYRHPAMRGASPRMETITWEAGQRLLADKVAESAKAGRDVVYLSHLITGARKELIDRWLRAAGQGEHLIYEPIAYEDLRRANEIVFGSDQIPLYRIDRADFLLSFGANFLEYWVSNVMFARQFSLFRQPTDQGKHFFAYVGPRLSMTAASADHWVMVPAGAQSLAARAFFGLVAQGRGGTRQTGQEAAIAPETAEQAAGLPPNTLKGLAERFLRAQRPLVLVEGNTFQDPGALETAVAANMAAALAPARNEVIDFSQPSSLGGIASTEQMRNLIGRMADGQIGVLIIDRANPVFNLPPSWGFERALAGVPLVVSFGTMPDETSRLAHLVLPSDHFLESWGDYSPLPTVRGALQPVMGRKFDTREPGDVLIATGRQIAGDRAFPEAGFYDVLRRSWAARSGDESEAFWQQSLQRGGLFGANRQASNRPREKGGTKSFSFSPAPGTKAAEQPLTFTIYPTIQFFDGRTANRPFLQEMPDPVTMITWSGWVEVHPETARGLGVENGDMVEIRSQGGRIEAPVFIYPYIAPRTLAMPLGHGHSKGFSRYALGESGNPVALIGGDADGAGGLNWSVTGVQVRKQGRTLALANTDGSPYQHDRKLAQTITFEAFRRTAGQSPEITMPLPEGWRKEKDFYPVHHHDEYRWAMAVDLDRCIGCQACVVACYAENNIGIVGKNNVLKGRVMSWLRIERYYEQEQPFIRFLPMLCQHCDEAPCEAVCPVFAPHHNKEGINNQVYNRCIGTRFCSQNCPWKVRRFNWFTFSHDDPLGWQLNPDVTVRQRGVMEKCSFCIQRVVQAKTVARSEGRTVRDMEFQPACAQTCPADVFVFGNLKDPNSRVSQVIKQARTYQVLGHLNTKTAVFYLKKIIQG